MYDYSNLNFSLLAVLYYMNEIESPLMMDYVRDSGTFLQGFDRFYCEIDVFFMRNEGFLECWGNILPHILKFNRTSKNDLYMGRGDGIKV